MEYKRYIEGLKPVKVARTETPSSETQGTELPHSSLRHDFPVPEGSGATRERSHVAGIVLVLAGVAMMAFSVLPAATPAAAGAFAGYGLYAPEDGGILTGMWGDDELYGGEGRDTVVAGSGNDFVEVSGGGRDIVRCGRGNDLVNADTTDTIAPDCETVFQN